MSFRGELGITLTEAIIDIHDRYPHSSAAQAWFNKLNPQQSTDGTPHQLKPAQVVQAIEVTLANLSQDKPLFRTPEWREAALRLKNNTPPGGRVTEPPPKQ